MFGKNKYWESKGAEIETVWEWGQSKKVSLS